MNLHRVARGVAIAAAGGCLVATTGLSIVGGVAGATTSPVGKYTASANIEGTAVSGTFTVTAKNITFSFDGVAILGGLDRKGHDHLLLRVARRLHRHRLGHPDRHCAWLGLEPRHHHAQGLWADRHVLRSKELIHSDQSAAAVTGVTRTGMAPVSRRTSGGLTSEEA